MEADLLVGVGNRDGVRETQPFFEHTGDGSGGAIERGIEVVVAQEEYTIGRPDGG